MSLGSALDAARHDVAYALRTLRRAPAFTLIAVATLAVGIGATTAVFSIVNGVLLRPLPYRTPSHLAMALELNKDGRYRSPSYPTYRDWHAAAPSLRGAIEGIAWVKGNSGTIATAEGPERTVVAYVTPNFFSVMAVRPILGRTFTTDESRSAPTSGVVLSYDTWRERYGGDSAVIGRQMNLNGALATIIGVMPPDAYPTFAQLWQPIGAIETSDSSLQRRGALADSRTVVRIADGADSLRAAAALNPIEQTLAAEYPAVSGGWTSAGLYPIRNEMLGDVGPTLYLLAGAVALVLLLACANVANLFAVRAAGRARELAVRSALGARRGRIARQLLTESLVLALLGGALGTGLAFSLVDAVRRAAAGQLPRPDQIVVSGAALAFALVVSILAALLVGIAPALGATRADLIQRLRGGASGAVGGGREARVRNGLAVSQLALALVLLVGAGLLAQSFRRAAQVPLGFDPAGLVTITVGVPGQTLDAAQSAAMYDRLEAAVRGVPGVSDAALVNHVPLTGAGVPTLAQLDNAGGGERSGVSAWYRTASANYLRTMRMHMVRGRWLNADDMHAGAANFVVNETMARRLWPGKDPVVQPLTLHRAAQGRPDYGQPIPGQVVGVVADVHQTAQDVPVEPEVYVPYTLEVWTGITVVARARDPARVIPALRTAVHEVEPSAPLTSLGGPSAIRQMSGTLAESLARRRLAVSLVGAFSAAALLLAVLGLYGVVAYGVAQRTREMGVRVALGATRRQILGLVLGHSARLVLVGLLVGTACAAGLSRFIRAMLFQTPAGDPVAYASTAAVLAAAALAAAYIPARRAAGADPTIAMRAE